MVLLVLYCLRTSRRSVFEGIADTGMQMLDWIENDDDRVQALMNAYRMGVCTVAAWKLHALLEPEPAVQLWLERNTFTGGAGWVANRMKFLSNPGRAVLIWSYWHGESNVTRVWCGRCLTHVLSAHVAHPLRTRWTYSHPRIRVHFDCILVCVQGGH